jgi:3-hydroxyacyl-CoA dehydrogenase
MTRQIKTVAVIGTGVIGASWSALFLAKGLHVNATDPAPNAEAALRKFISDAWPALEQLGLAPGASQSNLTFHSDMKAAIADVDFVQENAPERIEFKQKLYGELDELLAPDVIIASSSSGLKVSEIQEGCKQHPERCVLGHPFNPPHIIPLVEIVGGAKTSEESIERAISFYRELGKRPVRLNKEVPGHVANRLAAALYREVIYLVGEGVISVADIDDAVSWGPGLRWGVMGPNMLYKLGGGAGGMKHFFEQFTGPMTALWSVLGHPEITPELVQTVIDGVDVEAGSLTAEQLSEQRDELLLGLLALRNQPISLRTVA